MSKNFGGTLKLTGEKEYRASLKSINADLKLLTAEMKAATSAYDKNDKSVEKLTAENKGLNDRIDKQKEKVKKLKEILQQSEKELGENADATKDWKAKLYSAEGELNKLNLRLEKNEKALKDARSGANSYGKELDSVGMKTDSTGGKFETFGNVASTALTGIATVAASVLAGITAVSTGLAEATKSAGEYADNVLTESLVTGISTDKLQGYMYAAELIDVSTETLTGSMAKNIKSMDRAAKGSEAYVEVYDRLGVNIKDANGRLRDSEEVYWDLIDALGEVDNETERDAMAMQVLGKSAQDLNPLILQGSDRMKELTAEASEAGYVLEKDTLDAFGAFDDNMQRLEVGAEAAKNALGTVLLPVLTDLSEDGVDLLGKFTNAVNEADGDVGEISASLKELIPEAVDKFKERLPEMIEVGKGLFEGIGTAMVDVAPELIDGVGNLLQDLLDEMLTEENIAKFTDTGVDLFTNLVENASEIVINIVEKLPDIIDGVVDGLTNEDTATGRTNIDKMKEAGMELFVAMVENAPAIAAELITGAGDIINEIVGIKGLTSNDSKDKMEGAGTELGKSLIKGIVMMIPNFIASLMTGGEWSTAGEYMADFEAANKESEYIQKLKNKDYDYFEQDEDAKKWYESLKEYLKSTDNPTWAEFLNSTAYGEYMSRLQNATDANKTFYDAQSNHLINAMDEYDQMIDKVDDWEEKTKDALSGVDTEFDYVVGDLSATTREKFFKIGQDIMDGIKEGIRDSQTMLSTEEAVGYSIVDVAQAAMDAAEIGSPSKLFRDKVGKWIMPGVAEGIEDTTDEAVEAMNAGIEQMSGVDISVDKNITGKPVAVTVSFGDVSVRNQEDINRIKSAVIDAITDSVKSKR